MAEVTSLAKGTMGGLTLKKKNQIKCQEKLLVGKLHLLLQPPGGRKTKFWVFWFVYLLFVFSKLE